MSYDVRIRGIRQTLPSGFVLGRLSDGDGQAELVNAADLSNHLMPTLAPMMAATSSVSQWVVGYTDTLSTGLTLVGTTLTAAWRLGAVTALSTGLSISGTTLTNQWRAGDVTTFSSGIGISTTTLTVNWRAGVVTTVGTGLSISGTTINGDWRAGTVTALDPSLTLTSGTLAAVGGGQWNAGTVTLVSTGLSLSVGGILTCTVVDTNVWNAGTVTTLGSGLSLTSGTLTASGAAQQWTAGTVTSVAAGLTITANVLTPDWHAGTVATIHASLDLNSGTIALATQAATTLLGNPAVTTGKPSAIAVGTGLSLSTLGTLTCTVVDTNVWNAGTVTTIGTGLTLASGTLTNNAPDTNIWNAGTVTTLAAPLSLTSGTLSVAGSVGALGVGINAGTIAIYNKTTLTGTAAGTITIAPATGTSDVIVNLPAGGGTVTVEAAPTFARQRVEVDFIQGATASVVNLTSNFIFPTTGGPTSWTITPSANSIDRLMLISPNGTKYAVMALSQGFAL